jgi:hypothetical protein
MWYTMSRLEIRGMIYSTGGHWNADGTMVAKLAAGRDYGTWMVIVSLSVMLLRLI